MDNILIQRIYIFLQKENPTEDEIIEGATLLLRIAPGRNRSLYNSAVKRPKAMLDWIRAELKKHYDIRQRGLTSTDVEEYNNATVKLVEQTLAVVPSTVEQSSDETPLVPVLGVRGQREDHAKLPDDIQAIWGRNAERWKKMRQLHAQLAAMIAKPDYQPCDGNELCYVLRQTDTDMRNDYAIYDGYQVKEPETQDGEAYDGGGDSADAFVSNVKTIQNARATITRNLKEGATDKQLQKVQEAVNTLVAMKQEFKPETIERLKAANISIPVTETENDA